MVGTRNMPHFPKSTAYLLHGHPSLWTVDISTVQYGESVKRPVAEGPVASEAGKMADTLLKTADPSYKPPKRPSKPAEQAITARAEDEGRPKCARCAPKPFKQELPNVSARASKETQRQVAEKAESSRAAALKSKRDIETAPEAPDTAGLYNATLSPKQPALSAKVAGKRRAGDKADSPTQAAAGKRKRIEPESEDDFAPPASKRAKSTQSAPKRAKTVKCETTTAADPESSTTAIPRAKILNKKGKWVDAKRSAGLTKSWATRKVADDSDRDGVALKR